MQSDNSQSNKLYCKLRRCIPCTSALRLQVSLACLSFCATSHGRALARVLLGQDNPSGKLATTWAAAGDYCKEGTFGCQDDTDYTEGIYVGYRYFERDKITPLFPFGFGKSYTTFQIDRQSLLVEPHKVELTASVKNTGEYAGKEAVQLYVSVPGKRLDQPVQVLAAFAKTKKLEPQETANAELSFVWEDIASYDEERKCWFLPKGKYVLHLGNSSRDTEVCGEIELKEERILPPAESTYKEKILPEAEKLTDEELAYLHVGAFSTGQGIADTIGNSSLTVAGAAGETTHKLSEKNVPILVMADGPAGLRLSKKAFYDQKGMHSLDNPIPVFVRDYLPKAVVWLMGAIQPKPKKGDRVVEQYATAIPIGTAVAQSFNTELARLCGDIVGSEMERFGIHLWLAPALNINRNILCGRNFEYYSEDPIVSGKMAAAVTAGVQSHPGCGAVIKHFAANNQETNRHNNNSRVSERALREIYLRGFGICVREANPVAVMTSYNLLNGMHTSENRWLIEDVLRREFGFTGIVMTDWVTAGDILSKDVKYPVPNAAKVAAAGGDLFMPGSQTEIEQIISGLQNGAVTRRQLEINASRVISMARKLHAAREKNKSLNK